jgi:hypothetical protein
MSFYIDQLIPVDDISTTFKVSHATLFEDTASQVTEVSITAQRLMGRHAGFRIGGYYFSRVSQLSSAIGTVAANTLYAQPIGFGVQLIDTLALECTTATGNARMGLYAYNYTTGLPGALIVDGGAVALSVAIKELTFTQKVVGDCWIASIFDAGPTMRIGGSGSGGSDIGSADFQTVRKGIQVAQTYGALPDPFPAGAVVSSSAPLMAVKRAA